MLTGMAAAEDSTAPRMLLRAEVGRLRERESRRVYDAAVAVGILAGPRDSFVVRAQALPVMDTALCTDVLASMVRQSPRRWRTAWLIRSGTPELHDQDLRWLAAARTAFGIHRRTLDGFYVVTRAGWRDVLTGETREWVRLRL